MGHIGQVEFRNESYRAGLKPAPPKTRAEVTEIMRAFKTFSARSVNRLRGTQGSSVWQRNYYEHIIRVETELARIREYIKNNPLQWELDRENPLRSLNLTRQISEVWEV